MTTCSMTKLIGNSTKILIEFGPDATLGVTQPTELTLTHLQTTNGCPRPIPGKYEVLSIPVDRPQIAFTHSITVEDSILKVSKCAPELFIDIFSSKGMTYRNPQSITWSVLNVDSITTSAEKIALNNLVSTSFANMNYIKLNQTTIVTYGGKRFELQASATNFLGKTDTKQLIVQILSTKKILIEGVYSSYKLTANQEHHFYVSTMIPVCSGDNEETLKAQERDIVVTCELYLNDKTTLFYNMTSECTIPANTMENATTYQLKFTATNPSNSNMTSSRWSTITVKSSNMALFIDGGDRKISVDRTNTFIANVEPKLDNVVYHWG